jgi:hypothetical protein
MRVLEDFENILKNGIVKCVVKCEAILGLFTGE